jgi:hypothetical protein
VKFRLVKTRILLISNCFAIVLKGGENKVENLTSIGIFLGGLGVFFAGCAFLWFCSLYSKSFLLAVLSYGFVHYTAKNKIVQPKVPKLSFPNSYYTVPL